jgi:hypothetical protein
VRNALQLLDKGLMYALWKVSLCFNTLSVWAAVVSMSNCCCLNIFLFYIYHKSHFFLRISIFIFIFHSSHVEWVPVTTACRVPGLRIEETVKRYGKLTRGDPPASRFGGVANNSRRCKSVLLRNVVYGKVGTSGGLLWTRYWTFGFRIMWAILD